MSNKQNWKGKTVWITGASSGIGKALAIAFSSLGANLVLSARREDELKKVANECANTDTLILVLDVTDEASMPHAVEKVIQHFRTIDLLINNAGISQRSSVYETNISTYRKLFEVDVFGQIALTKQVLPIMLKQQSGHIAVTASVAGKVGVPFRTGYCAAKHAVVGFFEAMRYEVASNNIHVSIILPGFIRTNISKNAVVGDGSTFAGDDRDTNSGMSAENCASVIIRGLSHHKKEIPVGNGSEMHALWIKRFFPTLLHKIMIKQNVKRAKALGKKAL